MNFHLARSAWALFTALILLTTAGAAGAAGAAEVQPLARMPLAEAVPGPGPNRLDAPTTQTYRVGVGDVLALAVTFRPAQADKQPIRPGDQLVVSYHFSVPLSNKAYRVEVGDRVRLDFRYSPELSQVFTQAQDDKISVLSKAYVVQFDGTLALSGLSEPVRVLGMNASEIAALVREKYKGLLQIPDVLVSIDPQYLYHRSLMGLVAPYEEKRSVFDISVPHVYVTVPPDGKVSLPLVAGLASGGKTVQQLSEELTRHYRSLKFNLITVNIWFKEVADERHAQLRQLLAERNNPLRCEVLPGGRIALPLIPSYGAGGKALEQISSELTGLYRDKGLERVEVTAMLERPRSRVIRVMGAVATPGAYPIHGQADLWGMIALAGGFAEGANLAGVKIVRTGQAPRGPFDFNQYVASGDPATNPLLEGDEMIFVPRGGGK